MERAKEEEVSLVHFMYLPVEIVEEILKCNVLTIKDVLNFSATCRYYRCVVFGSNSLWKKKYWDRWGGLEDSFKMGDIENYFSEISQTFSMFKRAQVLLEAMPRRFYKMLEISEHDMARWTRLVNEKAANYMYLTSLLMEAINTERSINTVRLVEMNTAGNLTTQYYASKVLRHIRQAHITEEWDKYCELPPNEQLLEVGAAFVAQWYQPNAQLTAKRVSRDLDDIANLVKHFLKCTNPNHGIFKVDKKVLEKCRNYKLENTLWGSDETRQLIGPMQEIWLDVNEYSKVLFTNDILEYKGRLPMTVIVIYESLARRLGVKCEPIIIVNSPWIYLLKFCESSTDCFYMEICDGICRFALEVDVEYSTPTSVQVVSKMANELEQFTRNHTQEYDRRTHSRSSLELLQLVDPQNLFASFSLANFYVRYKMDMQSLKPFFLQQQLSYPTQVQRFVQNLWFYKICRTRAPPEPTAPRRTHVLKFAVGMVMTYLDLNCKCVIYGWELEPSDHNQPVYRVLLEDGLRQVVAQRTLRPTTNRGSLYLNRDIGQYFSHFYQTHYVPNQELEKEYPEDRKVRLEFHKKFLMNGHN